MGGQHLFVMKGPSSFISLCMLGMDESPEGGLLVEWWMGSGCKEEETVFSLQTSRLDVCFPIWMDGWMDRQRGSSTVGRRLGRERRPAPVESFFSITFPMILRLWSFLQGILHA